MKVESRFRSTTVRMSAREYSTAKMKLWVNLVFVCLQMCDIAYVKIGAIVNICLSSTEEPHQPNCSIGITWSSSIQQQHNSDATIQHEFLKLLSGSLLQSTTTREKNQQTWFTGGALGFVESQLALLLSMRRHGPPVIKANTPPGALILITATYY